MAGFSNLFHLTIVIVVTHSRHSSLFDCDTFNLNPFQNKLNCFVAERMFKHPDAVCLFFSNDETPRRHLILNPNVTVFLVLFSQ